MGLKLISEGKVATLVLAGGQVVFPSCVSYGCRAQDLVLHFLKECMILDCLLKRLCFNFKEKEFSDSKIWLLKNSQKVTPRTYPINRFRRSDYSLVCHDVTNYSQ